jgi:hypothetical protein
MNPASTPATATLTPAAATLPCTLSLRRAMSAIVGALGKDWLRIR